MSNRRILRRVPSFALVLLSACAAHAAPRVAPVSRLPLYFVANEGQADAAASFVVLGRDRTASFAPDGIVVSGPRREPGAARRGGMRGGVEVSRLLAPRAERPLEEVRVQFVSVGAGVEPEGVGPATPFNFFRGPAEDWHAEVPAYTGIVYPELWRGVDLEWSGEGGQLKSYLLVAPGADPDAIRFACPDASAVRIDDGGRLVLTTPLGELVEQAPSAWQEKDGREVPVAVSFTLVPAPGVAASWGYRVGARDADATLVIDPPSFVHAGFMGGPGDDRGLGIDVDGAGAAYVTGRFDTGADYDVYVGKVMPDGTGFTYFTILGGNNDDEGFDLDVDASGNAYVTGLTFSFDFPAVGGPDLLFNGFVDAFVTKLGPSGSTIVYSGFLGGNGVDFGERVVTDAAGHAYLHGPTSSTQQTFPVKTGPDRSYNGGPYDVFVAKIVPNPTNASLSKNLVYCGYIGGEASDIDDSSGFVTSGHVALGADGTLAVSGATASNENTFPTGRGFRRIATFDSTFGGGYDAFVAKVKASGRGLEHASYIGGSDLDSAFGMDVDASGNAYLTGLTDSDESTFPVVMGPDLTFNGGDTQGGDGFVAKVNAAGDTLVYCGYLGGSDVDGGFGLDVDAGGAVTVIGYTESSEATFPEVAGPDLTFNGAGLNIGDAFIARVVPVPSGATPESNLTYCGYIGGTDNDQAFWVALDGSGNAHVVGDTYSTEATFPDGDGLSGLPGPDTSQNGSGDGFVVKVMP